MSVHQTDGRCERNAVFCVIADLRSVGKGLAASGRLHVKQSRQTLQHDRRILPGDGRVGTEGAVRVAGHNAGRRNQADVRVGGIRERGGSRVNAPVPAELRRAHTASGREVSGEQTAELAARDRGLVAALQGLRQNAELRCLLHISLRPG